MWVVDICTSLSRRLHSIWLSALGLLQSELKMKLLEVEGARAPVPIAGDVTADARASCRTHTQIAGH